MDACTYKGKHTQTQTQHTHARRAAMFSDLAKSVPWRRNMSVISLAFQEAQVKDHGNVPLRWRSGKLDLDLLLVYLSAL